MQFMILFIPVLILALFLIRGRYSSLHKRGPDGERRVARLLRKLPEGYYSFHDLFIEREGYTTQIDHVVVSRYGIFVIETKNYSGNIYGSDGAEQWVQYLRRGEKHYFQNPIRQNAHHTEALKSLLGLPEKQLIPLIVFLEGATLHREQDGRVFYSTRLPGEILSYREELLSLQEQERVVEILSNLKKATAEDKLRHIEAIKARRTRRQALLEQGVCPRCGGALHLKEGSYGCFWGCANFPRCRFTARLDVEL